MSAAAESQAADPARVAEDALALLRTGRPAMAAMVLGLGPLPALVREALAVAARTAAGRAVADRTLENTSRLADRAGARLGAAEAEVRRLRAEGRALGAEVARRRRELRAMDAAGDVAPPRPRPRQVPAETRATGRVDPGRVAELPRVAPADMAAIAGGRVGLPAVAWRRLLAALDPPPAPEGTEACR